jgi:hypothetical protein
VSDFNLEEIIREAIKSTSLEFQDVSSSEKLYAILQKMIHGVRSGNLEDEDLNALLLQIEPLISLGD